MNNLTTRKIVFGLLMTLVLMFGVQGVAEAISRLTRSSGDLQTVTRRRRLSDTVFRNASGCIKNARIQAGPHTG